VLSRSTRSRLAAVSLASSALVTRLTSTSSIWPRCPSISGRSDASSVRTSIPRDCRSRRSDCGNAENDRVHVDPLALPVALAKERADGVEHITGPVPVADHPIDECLRKGARKPSHRCEARHDAMSAHEYVAGDSRAEKFPDTNTGSNIAKRIIHIGTCNLLRVDPSCPQPFPQRRERVAPGKRRKKLSRILGVVDAAGVVRIDRCNNCP
jgi:hypothetical protein